MIQADTIPITRHPVSDKKAAAIRLAVRRAVSMPGAPSPEGTVSRLAKPGDATAFYKFLCAPDIHRSVYTLPRQLTAQNVRQFIEQHLVERDSGDGVLFLNCDKEGEITGYTDLCIWPHWAAGELGGAIRPDQQNRRQGIEGAARAFGWMFEGLGLDLICETASLENVRTARLLDHLGFARKGEITSALDDGSTRASLVWELTRKEWQTQGFAPGK